MKKKIVLIIIFLIVVFLVGLLFIMHKEANTIILKNDVFTYELGDDISADVSDYLKDADSTKNINEYKIVTDDFEIVDKMLVINKDGEKVGDYNINILYKKISKKVIIKVVDTTSPEFTTFAENIKIEQTSEEVDLTKNFETSDLSEVKITLEGEYDLTKEGNYEINIIATDSSGNKSEKKSTITVYKKEVIKETPVAKQESNSNPSSKKEESKPSNNNNTSNNTPAPKPETPPKEETPNNPSTEKIVKYFLFKDGYTMLNVSEICAAELKKTNRTGICSPIQDENGIYLGMKLETN